MLVFGDAACTEPVAEKCARLGEAVRAIGGMPPGLARHSALVAALIEAGELLQGIADHDLQRTGEETGSPAQAAASLALRRLARAVLTSWRSDFARLSALPSLPFGAEALPDTVETRQCEGFAHYAVYPETYAAAAAGSGLSAATRVIGIRSIGATLGAIVAEALGAPDFATVRPAGHPFRRHLALGHAARRALLAPAACYAVVDEGPGLSGSSFGAVADLLEDHGVAPHRLRFFPSHAGPPGPRAGDRHLGRWPRIARPFVPFETAFLAAARREHRLSAWAAGLLGVAETPLEDISAGAWRRHCYRREADWPAVYAQQERRKFLMHAAGESWLLKFAGLGRVGRTKLALARRLAAAELIPPVAGECHGFLVQRWLPGARPLQPDRIDPQRLAEHIGRYLGVRARGFPAAAPGAPLHRLLEMARYNTARALGAAPAARLDRWAPDLQWLGARVRPILTDNRMHSWEWLVLPDSRLLKADALDHHAGHDLVGCQDIAWDVAGAAAELDLPPAAQARLCAVLEREAGRAPDPGLLAFYAPCYLAFQLGHWTMAAEAAAPGELPRLRATAARYAARLRCLLSASPAASRAPAPLPQAWPG
jgi:hypothetical protein